MFITFVVDVQGLFGLGMSFNGRTLVSRTRNTGSSPVLPTKENMSYSLQQLLLNKCLVNGAGFNVEEIIEKIYSKKAIKIIYGETYDQYGMTIDSLKYYLFLSLLHKSLEEMGIKAESFVIIGDIHSIKNKIVKNKERLLLDAKTRLDQINKIKFKLGLKFKPILMSDIFKNKEFRSRAEKISQALIGSEELKEIAKKTILQNRQSQEEEAGFGYVIEEVALIMDFDIKIGPPREIYYDQLARKLGANNLCGIYLRPTYPLGVNFDYFINHPEIEKYGLTPYKAGSNKMQDQRIIIGKTSVQNIRDLIEKSYIPRDILLANPILDLACIVAMSEQIEIQELVNDRAELTSRLLKLIKEIV